MAKPLGVILAGGLARRMGGGDKGLLTLGDSSLLARVIDRLSPQTDALVLNANGDPARFAEYGLPVVRDSIADYPGPLAGVLAGLDYGAEHGFEHIATVTADTPFFPKDLVARLDAARNAAHPIAMACGPHPKKVEVRHPVFALWPVSLRQSLRTGLLDGIRKVVAWAEPHGIADVRFPADAGRDPFFNVNTPEDLANALRLVEA